jgi:hypothetical protein
VDIITIYIEVIVYKQYIFIIGAQGETRTHTPVKAGDFEETPCYCFQTIKC